MARCYKESAKEYRNYGGRGINVCDAWHDPINFYTWAIANGWSAGLSIDRVNVDAGYNPENCRWATHAQQRENVQIVIRTNKTGYRGVSLKHGRGVWLARITVDGKVIHLGHHKTPLDAALAHDKYIIENRLSRPVNFENPYEIEARAAEAGQKGLA